MDPFQRKDREGWWIRFKDADGKWRTRKGGETEGEAWAKLERVNLRNRAIAEGLLNTEQAQAAEEGKRPIQSVIDEYETYLRNQRRSPAHIKEAVRCIKALVRGIGAKCLSDIKARPVERWLGKLVADGRSARTRNVYLMRTSALLNWALKREMVLRNPLRVIDKLNERVDRREVSRALTPDEFDRLIAATPDESRKLYYLLAGRVGLRWQEIRRLRWQHFDLPKGWVHLDASSTKAHRADILPLAPDVLNVLRVRGKKSGPVFTSSPQRRTFMNDLERAGVEYDHHRGQADRKSLRKTFGTHLAMAGVDFRLTVRLMRHSDPRLTQAVYTDPLLLDMQGAVERLAGTSGAHGEKEKRAVDERKQAAGEFAGQEARSA